MGVILSTAKDLFFGPVLFVILSVSEGSDVAFEGIKPGSFGQKAALRMTGFGCRPERSEGPVFVFQGPSPDPSSPAAPQDDRGEKPPSG